MIAYLQVLDSAFSLPYALPFPTPMNVGSTVFLSQKHFNIFVNIANIGGGGGGGDDVFSESFSLIM